MSDEVIYNHAPKTEECVETVTGVVVEPETVEKSDRGLFDMFGKKKEEEKCEEAAISSEFEQKVQVTEPVPEPEEKKESLFQKLHRSDSSSSSSSDGEECDENGEKKKKKKQKPLKEVIKEKIDVIEGHKEEEKIKKHEEDTSVPIEKYEVAHELQHGPPEPEEKKGFLEKIKEKLPGHHKKVEEEEEHVVVAPAPAEVSVVTHPDEGEPKEKKGIFEKIKEKIPGYHSKSEEEKEKEKVKECD